MALRIATNPQALTIQRHLSDSLNERQKALEQLGSGSRINRSADDPAGLALSEKLNTSIRSWTVAKRNALDSISLVQTAEGSLNEIGNILTRLKELAVQSSSDTIGNDERTLLNKEFLSLKNEISRINKSSDYNGMNLLQGVDIRTGDSIHQLDMHVGKNYIPDADADSVDNPTNIIRISLDEIRVSLGEDGLNIGEGEEGANVGTRDLSKSSLSLIDQAVERVSSSRAYLGAIQSRLESTERNLAMTIESENMTKSRIKDADFAEQSSRQVQYSILNQSAPSMLAQANSLPYLALSLIQ
jgi:flagellin